VIKTRDAGPDADFEPVERLALEAVVRPTGRPAIHLMDGSFLKPPIGWEILDQLRQTIEAACRSVGRLDLTGHPRFDIVGTGFLVADDVVMTNKHVAKEFSRSLPRKRWDFEPGMTARIDFARDLGTSTAAQFPITEIIGLHEQLDLALLRVATTSTAGAPLPPPLVIASQPPSSHRGRRVYVSGHPAPDVFRVNSASAVRSIFGEVFNLKRLQPGEILDVFDDRPEFSHDCSTLFGNSGSCVVDLGTNLVVGLHHSGIPEQANFAVALWQLTKDPLLKQAKAAFN
jgi:hypothetical protein